MLCNRLKNLGSRCLSPYRIRNQIGSYLILFFVRLDITAYAGKITQDIYTCIERGWGASTPTAPIIAPSLLLGLYPLRKRL